VDDTVSPRRPCLGALAPAHLETCTIVWLQRPCTSPSWACAQKPKSAAAGPSSPRSMRDRRDLLNVTIYRIVLVRLASSPLSSRSTITHLYSSSSTCLPRSPARLSASPRPPQAAPPPLARCTRRRLVAHRASSRAEGRASARTRPTRRGRTRPCPCSSPPEQESLGALAFLLSLCDARAA